MAFMVSESSNGEEGTSVIFHRTAGTASSQYLNSQY